MPHEFLLILYLLLFFTQIMLLILAWKRNQLAHWLTLYGLEIVGIIAAAGCFAYYNAHPGYMLSTLGHVLWSMGAMGLYCAMAAVTVVMHILMHFKK